MIDPWNVGGLKSNEPLAGTNPGQVSIPSFIKTESRLSQD